MGSGQTARNALPTNVVVIGKTRHFVAWERYGAEGD